MHMMLVCLAEDVKRHLKRMELCSKFVNLLFLLNDKLISGHMRSSLPVNF